MTIRFNQNIKKPFLDKVIKNGFQPRNVGNGITVYSGVQPTANVVLNNWTNYKSNNSNYLTHFNEGGWKLHESGQLLQLLSGFSDEGGPWMPSVPLRSGTATWAILWGGNVTQSQTDGIVIPMNNFLVVSVTTVNGSGIIRFQSTSFVTGTPVVIYDGTIGATVL